MANLPTGTTNTSGSDLTGALGACGEEPPLLRFDGPPPRRLGSWRGLVLLPDRVHFGIDGF